MSAKTFGVAVGNAAAASVDLFDSMIDNTGQITSDFVDGFSSGYDARRTKDLAARSAAAKPVLATTGGKRVRKAA